MTYGLKVKEIHMKPIGNTEAKRAAYFMKRYQRNESLEPLRTKWENWAMIKPA